MKLAKIREDVYINPCNITSIEFDDEYNTTLITMVNGDVFSLKLPIKKALDAICGSEEYRKSNAFIDEKGHLHNSHFKTNS